jgi:CheY-like chemotaxis protein
MNNAGKIDLSQVSVLVLDDNQNFISIMRSMLRGFGVGRVVEATEPSKAFELIGDQHVDIAFIDLKMPLIDGIAFARMIRKSKDSPNRKLPLVLVTADATLSTVKDAINAGIEEFIVKPVRSKDVLARLVRLMDSPREYYESGSYFGPDRRRRIDPKYTGPERRAPMLLDDAVEIPRTPPPAK